MVAVGVGGCIAALLERGGDDDDFLYRGSIERSWSPPVISSCCSRCLSFPRVELKERKIRGVTTPKQTDWDGRDVNCVQALPTKLDTLDIDYCDLHLVNSSP